MHHIFTKRIKNEKKEKEEEENKIKFADKENKKRKNLYVYMIPIHSVHIMNFPSLLFLL